MPPNTSTNEGSLVPQLKDPAATMLLFIKKHTSLDEQRLRELAQISLDDPNTFDARVKTH
jgi:hypothetical protein